jgi:hypothetical protein
MLKNIITSPYLWLYILIMIGCYLFMYGIFGGSIDSNYGSLNPNEVGFGFCSK